MTMATAPNRVDQKVAAGGRPSPPRLAKPGWERICRHRAAVPTLAKDRQGHRQDRQDGADRAALVPPARTLPAV
jgi:hypothetical protein